MVTKVSFNHREEIYTNCLREIKNIKFTVREVDIISCILHNRGEKKIASLLSISPRTVSAHTYNMTSKISGNSRDYIIDFIEKSGKLHFFRQYYLYLLLDLNFEKALKKISRIHNLDSITYKITFSEEEEEILIKNLSRHLRLAGFNLIIDRVGTSEGPYINSLDFDKTSGKDYYFVLLEFIKKLVSNSSIDQIISEFTEEYNALSTSLKELNIKQMLLKPNQIHESKFFKYFYFTKSTLFKQFAFIILLSITFFGIYNMQTSKESLSKQNKITMELDKFLSKANSEFTASYMDPKQTQKNYDLAKKIENILNISDIKLKKLYFSDPGLSGTKIVNYLDNLHSIASYYTFQEHNGIRSRELLEHAQEITYLYLNSKSIVTIDFDKLTNEELYNELKAVKDLPEMHTRTIYFLGRSYIYQGDKTKSKKYFELASYLGNKLDLFESYLAVRSGIGILKKDEIDSKINNGYSSELEREILDYISLLRSLKNDNRQYKIGYKPGIQLQKLIVPKDDVFNQIDCLEKIVKLYSGLVIISNDASRKKFYINKILDHLLEGGKENNIFKKMQKIPERKQASVYNSLGQIFFKFYDIEGIEKFTIKLAKILNISNDDKSYFLKGLFEIAMLKSRNNDFTKADAYDGIIKLYQKQLESTNLNNEQSKSLNIQIIELEKHKNTINQALSRTPPD
jgi:DNA-binding CsgD family transcriptional regulator